MRCFTAVVYVFVSVTSIIGCESSDSADTQSSRAVRAPSLAASSSSSEERAAEPAVLDAGDEAQAQDSEIAPTKAPRCAPGMIEVEGDYCTALMHRCQKGGRTIDGKPSNAADPYHCDEYLEGYAKCLGKEQPKHFCIDDYEYPNQKGATPMVMVTWYDAQKMCEAQGKRLCGDDEWTLACEGPERQPYAYGWRRDKQACNIDKPWRKPDDGILAGKDQAKIEAEIERLSQRVPSGEMSACVSPYGVHDMGGNVDEWTVNVTLHGKPYQSMFKGGHWCKGARNRCRPHTESHDETTAYYAEGFRCCADVLPTQQEQAPSGTSTTARKSAALKTRPAR